MDVNLPVLNFQGFFQICFSFEFFRWNSTFDSIVRVCEFIEKDRGVSLQEVIKEVTGTKKQPGIVITGNEMKFLADFRRVMEPLAIAIKTLQGEGNENDPESLVGLGHLIPTIRMIEHWITKIVKSGQQGQVPMVRSKVCLDIAKKLLGKVTERFQVK